MSNSESPTNDEFFKGVEKYPYNAVSRALEIIPRTLIQNCGGNVVKQLTTLRAKHHQQSEQFSWGIDGETGQLVDMHTLGIWEPIAVKMQTIKTAIEVNDCSLVKSLDIYVVIHRLLFVYLFFFGRRPYSCFVLMILCRARRKPVH
jgi:chaperonin GroEL (HSP60 family)